MSPDLRLATAFIFPLGGAGRREAVELSNKHKRFLRGEVAKRVNLKFAPEIRFQVDTFREARRRIDALLATPRSPATSK